jgi:7-cyano-7-deazaguanine synthase in queuosine biosynthesis
MVWGIEDRHDQVRLADDVTVCQLGHNVIFNHQALSEYFWREPDPVDLDLLTIAGMVCFADRSIKRTTKTWPRDLSLRVPVQNLDIWQDEQVSFCLVESLRFLTGDSWSFDFRRRRKNHDRSGFLFRPPYEGKTYVMPYSGGLDSYAGYSLFKAARIDAKLILVSTIVGGRINTLLNSTIEYLDRASSLRVPIRFRGLPRIPEASYRTRTFLYFLLAAVAAKFARAEAILVSENGQGALGPSLVPWGNQHPFQSSHPAFAYRIRMLLETIWGSEAPKFEYPNIWKTKAQILRGLSEVTDPARWGSTVSCGFNVRRAKAKRALPNHCGVCGGCLLRRLALISGGFRDIHETEPYFWKDLNAPSLGESVVPSLRKDISTGIKDVEMAQAAVIDHQSLSCLAGDFRSTIVARSALDISESLSMSVDEALLRLHGLLIEHRNEWDNFLDFAGPGSWITRSAEIVK